MPETFTINKKLRLCIWLCKIPSNKPQFVSIHTSFLLLFSIILSSEWEMLADGDGGSRRGLVASGQWSYLAPVWRKNCFWLGWEQPAIARGPDAVETLWEPIRKAIDQSPLISQWRAHPQLQSKTQQLSLTDRWLAGFSSREPSQKWIHGAVYEQRQIVPHSCATVQYVVSKEENWFAKLKMTHQRNETMGCFHRSTY